jgi:hypothetical protein
MKKNYWQNTGKTLAKHRQNTGHTPQLQSNDQTGEFSHKLIVLFR